MKVLLWASTASVSTAIVIFGGLHPGSTDAEDPSLPTVPLETIVLETIIVEILDLEPPETTSVPSLLPSTIEVSVPVTVEGEVTEATVVDDDVLEAALLTAEDLNGAQALDYLGDDWQPDDRGVRIIVSGKDESVGVGLCPDGDHFRYPASLVGVHFDQWSSFDDDASTPENYSLGLTQNMMSFERSDSADWWIGAYESCIDQPWHEEGDPDEYISVEQIEIADPGVETTGFVVLYAHEDGGETAHDEGVAFVRLSPTLLVAMHLTSDADPTDPYEPAILSDLVAAAVTKVEAVLE